MADSFDWGQATAPTLADFERLAGQAWNRLPPDFRQMCGDLVIRCEEFAIDEVLDELGIESPLDLMGLYQGVSLDHKSVSDAPRHSRLLGRGGRNAGRSDYARARARNRPPFRVF